MGAMSKFAEMNALAAGGASPYQALVCVFLTGGNDGHNTVIPIATAQQNYSLYAANRGPLALASSSLLPVHAGNDTYGLHPSPVEIQNLCNPEEVPRSWRKRLLVSDQFRDTLPHGRERRQERPGRPVLSLRSAQPVADLGSHWTRAATGWGGRMADALEDS